MPKSSSFLTLNSTGFHRVAYKEWGPENGKPLLCVHGLTGSSEDFKYVGEYLSKLGYRTIAIDMPGRGASDFLPNPNDYAYTQYIHDLNTWFAHLGITAPNSIDYLGVSMGGLLGILLAGLANTPIKRMILSDVGPEVPAADLALIREYLTRSPAFESLDEVIGAFKQGKGSGFDRGPMSEDQYRHYATTHFNQRADGKFVRSFDANIGRVFEKEPIGNADLWPYWDNITQPVLALRGELSTLFPMSVANAMIERKSGAEMNLVVIPGCGHVPSLYPDDQIKILADWLQPR